MIINGPAFPADPSPQLGAHPTLYLLAAALSLLIALHYWRRAIQPVGELVRAVAAAALVAFTISVAVVLLTAVALSLR